MSGIKEMIKALDVPAKLKKSLLGKDLDSYHDEVKSETLKDPDIKQFIATYQEVLDYDMIKRALPNFREFIKYRDHMEAYVPHLKIENGQVIVRYSIDPDYKAKTDLQKWRKKLDISNMSLDNQMANISHYDLDDMGRQEAYSACLDLIKDFKRGHKQKGIWLVGGVGIGKSYLLSATAKEINIKGASVTMIEVAELFNKYFDQMRKDSDRLEKLMNHYKYVDLLILDDIGAESLRAYDIDKILYPILNERYKKNKLTCFTSNLTIMDYASRLIYPNNNNLDEQASEARAKRTIDRINALAVEVQAYGKNRRNNY
ncbi:ATP-binding protein [Aerococcus sp. UMB1112A]|uniref:ATP-binding protein n=1 Tax=Aerococcus sp. UMB1112A TaxID=3050609 RepID=UPI00255134F8|nr:ATP-binding protein [Aerococcus sp. UMB1112A]MDK8502109.1 ATP-binding protein [Aerococcus sp. UMB1112A]